MAVTAVNVVSTLILGFFNFEIIKVISKRKIPLLRYLIGIIILWSVNISTVIFVSTQVHKIAIIFISCMLIGRVTFIHTTIGKILFANIIYQVCGILGDLASYYIFTIVGISVVDVQSNSTLLLISNVNLFMLLIIAILILKFVKERFLKTSDDSSITQWNKHLLVAAVILFANIYIITMYQVNKTKIEKFIWFMPLTFFIVLIFAAYSQFLVKYKDRQNNQLQYYLNTMSKLSNDIKQFKHDFNNVLISLYGLAENKEWDALHTRLMELQGSNITKYSSEIEAMVNIREPSLISLLAAKMFYAHKHKINFYIESPHIINDLPINGTDFIRIVGILIDNAIEASLQCTIPEVGVIFLIYEDYFELIVQNSIMDEGLEVAAIGKRGFSTKGSGRGTGLSSLTSILDNYQPVEWNTFIKNNMFMQCIGFKRK